MKVIGAAESVQVQQKKTVMIPEICSARFWAHIRGKKKSTSDILLLASHLLNQI